ncbi:hypothetical protein B0H10DRAFT_1958464 [Mycena sp. CBHHK59/15]|nr:hypothetical protein B0H10DRAFT_1958464 [Mycena sp. CBHHK59/15]
MASDAGQKMNIDNLDDERTEGKDGDEVGGRREERIEGRQEGRKGLEERKMTRKAKMHGIYRHVKVWVEHLLCGALEHGLQAGRVCEAEDAEAVEAMRVSKQGRERHESETHLGSDLGAHMTVKDSGSMRWKFACMCRSTEDMKPAHVCPWGRGGKEGGKTHMIGRDACGSRREEEGR